MSEPDPNAPLTPEAKELWRFPPSRADLRALLREGIALFRDPVSGPLAADLRAAQRDTILSRAVTLIWLSVFVMPTAIGGYTLFFAPEQAPLVGLILAGAIAAVLAHRALIVRGAFRRHYHLAMLVLVGGVFGVTGSAVQHLTRNTQGDFFFAFFLIYFAFTALFPASASWILATSGALIAGYVGVLAIADGGLTLGPELTSNLLYLLELTLIGVVLNRVLCRLFFDERRSRIELGQANAVLRQLDEAKTRFFSNISHELRTPLTLILTPVTHILDQHPDLPPEVRQRLKGIQGNANRLLKMVNMLLDFSRVEAGKVDVVLTEVALDDLAHYTASLFEGTAEHRGVKVALDVQTGGLHVATDIDKVEQMMVNLVGNALKFTPAGGTITIGSRREGDTFLLFVRDTGIGIAPQHQQLVFQRFGQVQEAQKASIKGTGIGLSMVQEYARVLGGWVELVSEVGKGSTFTLRLPIGQAPARRGEAAPAAIGGIQRDLAVADLVQERAGGEQIRARAGEGAPWLLVVDDNPSLVQLVSSILEDDYNLYLANNGEEALDRLRQSRVDLVVSDVMMPGISGIELCRQIRADDALRAIPVILLTARGGTTEKVEGLDSGADDYIGKPFDPAELRARIRSLFDRRALVKSLAERTAELQRTLETLKAEELKLVASEKMRTLGDLAAGIFHELHNYMNMIYNGAVPLKEMVGMVGERPGDLTGEDIRELLELAGLMIEASQASLSITGELKAYAHQGANTMKDADIHDLIRSNVRMFGKLQGSLVVRYEFEGSPLLIHCAPSRLLMVFTNLLKNAFEAMQGAGTVTIRTLRRGDAVEIQVEDSGPGIPASFQARLFEPFQTTKVQGKGLGLGLSLVRKVILELGGDIRYDSAYAGGARFVILIPLVLAQKAA